MATDARIDRLDRRYTQLKTQRASYEGVWRELAQYVLPRRASKLLGSAPGQDLMTNVFDSTPIHANEILAASMQGSLTSSTTRWFRLRHRLDQVNEDAETQLWLEACARIMYKVLNASNFASEGLEGYLDLGGFGVTAVMMQENPNRPPGSRFGGLLFEALTIGDYVIAEGPEGTVNTVFRQFSKSASAVRDQWGERALMSGELAKTLDDEPDRMVEVVHAIYPRRTDRSAQPDPKAYVSCYWLDSDKTLLSESGFWEFPVLVPRWAKSGRETYGRGPGHTALPDAKTLNRAVELHLRAWDKMIDPPLLAIAEGVISQPRLTPGGITYVQNKDALTALNTGATRVDVTQLALAELRAQLKDTFYNSQLQLPNQPYMTAEEIIKRYELMQRVLGPTLGRLESEYLGPMIRRAFMLLYRAGLLPPPPQAVLAAAKAGFSELDIEYEGPLSRAQRYGDVEAVQKTIVTLKPIVEIKPEVMDNFDLDKIARKVATDTGVGADLLRKPIDVTSIRRARAKVKTMEMQMMKNQSEAATARDASQAVATTAETVRGGQGAGPAAA